MITLAFDTHKAVKTLREAGFEEGQAEAVVATFGNAMSEDMATKTDVAALKTDVAATKTDVAALKTDVAALKTDIAALKTDMLALEQRLTVRLYTTVLTGVGLIIAANGIMLAAFKLF